MVQMDQNWKMAWLHHETLNYSLKVIKNFKKKIINEKRSENEFGQREL